MMKISLKTKKISLRLAVVYAVIFSAALLSVNVATYISISYYVYQTSSSQLKMMNLAISEELVSKDNLDETNFESFSKIAENVGLRVLINGKTIYNTIEEFKLALPEYTAGTVKHIKNNNSQILYLNEKKEVIGLGTVLIQNIKNMDNEQEYLHALLKIMSILDLFILLFSVGVGFFISKEALKPIDKITIQAKEISVSNLAQRITISGPDDELKRLADTFNDLLVRIQYSYERQNQFTLDASHELATPLAVIKGYIDLIDCWGKEQPEVLEEGIQSIKREVKNMTGLLDTLLFLSKSDNDLLSLDYQIFSLQDLIFEVIDETKMLTHDHQIEHTDTMDVSIRADRGLLKQMLRALIDNSIKYTPAGGTIILDYSLSKKYISIKIEDTGIGIPENELSHIFDRFFRVDKARSRSIGGFGLGLSIVQLIVRSHKGTITATSQLGKGTTMVIKIPID